MEYELFRTQTVHSVDKIGVRKRTQTMTECSFTRIDIYGRTGSITGETALRLARYFGTTPQYWIDLEARYDLDTARDEWEVKVKSEVRPRSEAA